MTTALTWGNDVIRLEFDARAAHPVLITAISHLGSKVDNFSAVDCAEPQAMAFTPEAGTSRRVVFPYPMPILQLQAVGRGIGHYRCGRRLVETSLGESLHFVSASKSKKDGRSHLSICMSSPEEGIEAEVHFELDDSCQMFRVSSVVKNVDTEPLVLESVPTFSMSFGHCENGPKLEDELSEWSLLECRNDWLGEGRWSCRPMREVCPKLRNDLLGRSPQGAYSEISSSTFSTGTALPMGLVTSKKLGLSWIFQVEHDGPWRWDVGEGAHSDGYFALSGPTYVDHGWSKKLLEGESFTTVPVAVAPGDSFDQAIESLTRYRRMRHLQADKIGIPNIIFNDYMNTLNGDPTTEKLLPLIDAAAEVGADIFCIDAGWYDDTGNWWPSVGEWKPSKKRFPGGLSQVVQRIHKHGMKPGLWLEPEVVGVRSPLADILPDSAFFQLDGQRIVEQERYFLDFRNPEVTGYLDGVIDRLIREFGVGYFKFDYNVTPGLGTSYQSDSPGDGLLGHNRAYQNWISGLYERHPGLILENCSSGGMRTDFAQSSMFRLLSTSDQQDFKTYASITSTAPMSMLPEQAGNWAYPAADMDDEDFVFALSNTLLGHFFLSGYLNRFSPIQLELVKEAVSVYRNILGRQISQGVPFWPLGLPKWTDDKLALGIRVIDQSADGSVSLLLTIWSRDSTEADLSLPLPAVRGRACDVKRVFPSDRREETMSETWSYEWDKERGILNIHVPTGRCTARTIAITSR